MLFVTTHTRFFSVVIENFANANIDCILPLQSIFKVKTIKVTTNGVCDLNVLLNLIIKFDWF